MLSGALASVFGIGFKHLLSKDVGGSCSEPNYCRGSLCVGATRFAAVKDGYCSKKCGNDQDCPSGYRCKELAVEEMGRAPMQMQVCLRY